jgi:hypothetical protein
LRSRIGRDCLTERDAEREDDGEHRSDEQHAEQRAPAALPARTLGGDRHGW